MKKIILAAGYLLIGYGLGAMPALAQNNSLSQNEICAAIGDAAETVMGLRQNNVPLSTLFSVIAENTEGEEELAALYRELAFLAYDEPAYVSEQGKSRSIVVFRDAAEVECFRGFR